MSSAFPTWPNLSWLRSSSFLGNVLVVISGTGMAQAITFAFAPALSRLYGPSEFGLFDSFTAAVAILSTIVTLQYSQAILLPSDDQKGAQLLTLSCGTGLICAVLTGAVLFALPGHWVSCPPGLETKSWFTLGPAAALVAGVNQSLTFWLVRRKAFRQSASSQVLRAITAGTLQSMAGLWALGSSGLIWGAFAAEIAGGLFLGRSIARQDWHRFRQALQGNALTTTARQYADFPLYTAPQYLANAVSQGAPVLLLISFYGAAVGGLYAFAMRVLQAPMNLVLTALRQVLFQKMTEVHHASGDVRTLFRQSTASLLVIALPPAGLAWILAPALFSLIFGEQWRPAGEYARWLLVWMLPAFCNVPATLVGRVLRKQRQLLSFDVVLLMSRVAVLVMGGAYFSALETIAAFSVVGAVFNIGLIYYMGRLLRESTSHLTNARTSEVALSQSLA